MEKVKLPFDLKISKLQGKHWSVDDQKLLAWQLYEEQGEYRESYENRLFIVFLNSSTSSTAFLQRNEIIMLREVTQMLKTPEDFWFPLWVGPEPKKVWACVLLISPSKYIPFQEVHEHELGEGLREPSKAEFSTKFVEHLSLVSDGLIVPNSNTKEHGLDGYIFLPKMLMELKS